MKRNITLDYYKIILSILIVYLHFIIPVIYDFPGYTKYMSDFGYLTVWEISGFTKLGVPAFFMLNGYFLSVSDRKKTMKYVIRILKLYVVWTLFYLPWMPFDDPSKRISFFLNLIFGFYHLWYLSALMGAAVILYFLNKYIKNPKVLLIIVLILFFIGYYIQSLIGSANIVLVYLFRNCLFFALPYLTMGYLIRKTDISRFKYLFPVIGFGVVFILLESYGYMKMIQYYDMYISALILCPFIFIYLLKHSQIKEVNDGGRINDLSSAIYYIHPAFLMSFNSIHPQDNASLLYWFPFIALSVIMMSFVVIQANKTIRIFL